MKEYNFDLRKFLTENKLTTASKQLAENTITDLESVKNYGKERIQKILRYYEARTGVKSSFSEIEIKDLGKAAVIVLKDPSGSFGVIKLASSKEGNGSFDAKYSAKVNEKLHDLGRETGVDFDAAIETGIDHILDTIATAGEEETDYS